MSNNRVDSHIDDLNGLNEEVEQLIDEIEHMGFEEGKGDDINYEDVQYYGEDNDLQRANIENYGTDVEQLQLKMEDDSYKRVGKKL